jgi:hypothetical protein
MSRIFKESKNRFCLGVTTETSDRSVRRPISEDAMSFADTKSIALNIAQAFADQGRSPAR